MLYVSVVQQDERIVGMCCGENSDTHDLINESLVLLLTRKCVRSFIGARLL